MAKRRPIGGKDPAVNASGEDALTRLIRAVARQAAREVFKDALDACAVKDLPLLDRSKLERARAPSEPGEQFLSVAEVAKRLGVSEKTVRRKIASEDLPAHRVGKLIRVNERDLTAYVMRGASPEGMSETMVAICSIFVR